MPKKKVINQDKGVFEMVKYNKRNMGYLEMEINNSKNSYLIESLNLLRKTEQTNDETYLNLAKDELDKVLPKLDKENGGWRTDLLINYFLNLELAVYKQKDANYTKWTIFLEKVRENRWEIIENFTKEIDEYISSKDEPNNINPDLTEEVFNQLNNKFQKEVFPYIHKNLSYVDRYRAELRLSQRLNLLKRKIPVNQNASFGKWVQKRRTDLKWSLNKLAEKSGFSPSYICRIEKGTRKNPTPQVMTKIIEAMGYDAEQYFKVALESNQEEKESKLELIDLVRSEDYTINGREVNEEQRELLVDILNLINEDTVLQPPAINKLKEKIKNYQESIEF